MRPVPWTPRPIPTIWLDYRTGRGVSDGGQWVQAAPGERRKQPNLTDMLNLAGQHGAERIMFTGDVPQHVPGQKHWLLVRTPGWAALNHWLEQSSSATGRYQHTLSGQKVTVKVAAEWFGSAELKPDEARVSWELTEQALRGADEKARLFFSPTMTGSNLWALSLPQNVDPVHVENDIADELRSTSGQHHVEHLVAGPNAIDHPDVLPLMQPSQYITEFGHIDGRFMYSAVCANLGIGPARRLNREHAFQLLEDNPYCRARFNVRFTVPENWNHIGILAVKEQGNLSRWIYPNRPGATHETWADSSEIWVARKHGWLIDPLEAVEFTTKTLGRKRDGSTGEVATRPLDAFADRMVRARERVMENPDFPENIRSAVAAALRAILLQTIGGFHSPGRASTVVVDDLSKVPPQYVSTVQQHGDVWSYKTPRPNLNERSAQFYHPEFSTQVWGRARARLLDSPSATGRVGVLAMDPSTVLGVYGDAVYTTQIPDWSLPVRLGGGDDGKAGRLRLQGGLRGRFRFPVTLQQRDRLQERADTAGLDFLNRGAA